MNSLCCSHHVPRQHLHEGARGRTGAAPEGVWHRMQLSQTIQATQQNRHTFWNRSLLSFKFSKLQNLKEMRQGKVRDVFNETHFLTSHMQGIRLGCKRKLSHKYAGLNTCQHMFLQFYIEDIKFGSLCTHKCIHSWAKLLCCVDNANPHLVHVIPQSISHPVAGMLAAPVQRSAGK